MHAVEAALVEAQGGGLVLAQGFLGDGHGDERVAVTVAADPRAEAEEGRELERLAGVRLGQGVFDAAVEQGREVEEDVVEEVEAVADLVEDGGLAQAGFVGLPERDDLLAHGFERVALLLGGELAEVEAARTVAMRRSLARMVRRLASVGWAVKTGWT